MPPIPPYRTISRRLRTVAFALLALATLILPTTLVAQDAPPTSPTPSGRALIVQKLDSIVIDKIDFDKADVTDVIAFLQKKSKELDPDKQGINFVVALTPSDDHFKVQRQISLTLENIKLGDVLKEVCNQTNLASRVEDYAVYISPAIDIYFALSVRTYSVPTGFFANTSTSDHTTDVKKELIARGVTFPDGASATFIPESGKLVVRDTTQQLDMIATLFDAYTHPSANQ